MGTEGHRVVAIKRYHLPRQELPVSASPVEDCKDHIILHDLAPAQTAAGRPQKESQKAGSKDTMILSGVGFGGVLRSNRSLDPGTVTDTGDLRSLAVPRV